VAGYSQADDDYDVTMVAPKRQMAAAEFKAKCLQVAKDGRPVIVTKRGKPVVRIVPIEEPKVDGVFGCLADRFKIVGDIEISPFPASMWEVLK